MSIRNDLNITRVGVIFSLEFNEICNIRVYQLSPEDVAMSRAYVWPTKFKKKRIMINICNVLLYEFEIEQLNIDAIII